jgi:hypothetical protein
MSRQRYGCQPAETPKGGRSSVESRKGGIGEGLKTEEKSLDRINRIHRISRVTLGRSIVRRERTGVPGPGVKFDKFRMVSHFLHSMQITQLTMVKSDLSFRHLGRDELNSIRRKHRTAFDFLRSRMFETRQGEAGSFEGTLPRFFFLCDFSHFSIGIKICPTYRN